MCGIAGFMTDTKRYSKADDFISDSFVAGSLRGMDSCGVVSIEMKKDLYSWQKLPVCGSYFITDRAARNVIRDANLPNTLTLAHTRAATHGSVSINNAHPFIVEGQDGDNYREMVGVHNGSLTGWASKKGASKFDVDSEWALNKIFDLGDAAFEEIEGAYCFVWWDNANPDVLNISLNDQRPMHVAFLKDGGMAFASEAGMLAWLLERNNIKRDGNILVLSSNFHYQFNVDNPKEFKKEAIKQRKAVTFQNSYYGARQTTVQALEGIFSKIRADGTPVHTPFVTKDEAERATMDQMQGLKGEFNPSYLDNATGELCGLMTITDTTGVKTELFAMVRNARTLKWTTSSIFQCSILGVTDDSFNTVVLSWPKVALPNNQQAA